MPSRGMAARLVDELRGLFLQRHARDQIVDPLVGQIFNLRPICNRLRGGLQTRRRLQACPTLPHHHDLLLCGRHVQEHQHEARHGGYHRQARGHFDQRLTTSTTKLFGTMGARGLGISAVGAGRGPNSAAGM
jgi:hypothetical protein